jgi:hypothetical protein
MGDTSWLTASAYKEILALIRDLVLAVCGFYFPTAGSGFNPQMLSA